MSADNQNQQQKPAQEPVSCYQAQPQRNLLHEKRKNQDGEWKVERSYEVLSKLGKGGFAKVYLAKEIASNEQYAIKVVDKSSLEKDSFKEKEIKFQKSLNHENVVKYYTSFEDSQNVYIVLEYCSNQTFKELLDRRKRLTEIEVKSHLFQIIQSLKYIHSKGIIHRDLKIANIFLNDKMVVKLADFGLSAMMKFPQQKRKTVCGTPNYIAPEVLKNQGHDYLVDNWAIGVIVYTFLIGKPPFEEKEVENTLRNIKANRYSFPENCLISKEAKDFIQKILVPNPEQRLTMDQMLVHPFMKSDEYYIPKTLPTCTLALPPTASYLRKLRKSESTIAPKNQLTVNNGQVQPLETNYASNENAIPQLAATQSTKHFQRSNHFYQVQSSSTANFKPTSLSQQHATGNSNNVQDTNSTNTNENNTINSNNPNNNDMNIANQENDNYQLLRMRSQENIQFSRQFQNYFQGKKENSLQKYPSNQQFTGNPISSNQNILNQHQSPPKNALAATGYSSVEKQQQQQGQNKIPSLTQSQKFDVKKYNTIHISETNQNTNYNKATNPYYNIATSTLPQTQGSSPLDQINLLTQNQAIYLFDYIDCSSKFGLAYYLNNGNVGILLNDGNVTQIVDDTFEHIQKVQDSYVVQKYPIKQIPPQCQNFYRLTTNIKEYFINKYKLISPKDEMPEGEFEKDIYLKKFIFTKQASFFRFSNKDLQVIFMDKSEVVITQQNKNLYFKDKRGNQKIYTLKSQDKTDLPNDVRKRINYIKEVFLSGNYIKTQQMNKLQGTDGASGAVNPTKYATNVPNMSGSTVAVSLPSSPPAPPLIHSSSQTQKLTQNATNIITPTQQINGQFNSLQQQQPLQNSQITASMFNSTHSGAFGVTSPVQLPTQTATAATTAGVCMNGSQGICDVNNDNSNNIQSTTQYSQMMKTNNNTTSSTNNSVSTQQQTPQQQAFAQSKYSSSQQLSQTAKLSLYQSQKLRVSVENYQSPVCKPVTNPPTLYPLKMYQ